MVAILYSEVNILCIMLFLLICFKVKSGTYTQRKQILFRRVLLSNCFLFALDIIWIFVNSKSLSVGITANWALNIAYYITSGIVGFCWFIYSENAQQSRLVGDKKHILMCSVPVIFLVIITFASVKTGWLFYIDDDNIYHRGPFYFTQLLCSYGYVIFAAGKALVLSKKTANYAQKIEYRTLACYVIAPLIAGTLQVFVPGDFTTMCGNYLWSIVCVSYYAGADDFSRCIDRIE